MPFRLKLKLLVERIHACRCNRFARKPVCLGRPGYQSIRNPLGFFLQGIVFGHLPDQTPAFSLLRAHRLWETFLEQLGTPAESLHEQAHILEHLHDENAVDYLDDALGHPLTDPHGAEIPEDFVHLVPGAVVPAAMLREGHVGVIAESAEAVDARLSSQTRVITGPRRGSNDVWTLVLPDGQEVELNHQQADRVQVRLETTGFSSESESGS